MRITLKFKISITVLAIIIISTVINLYSLSNYTSNRLSYLYFWDWKHHYQHGLIPMPINKILIKYIIYNDLPLFIKKLEDDENLGLDYILSLSDIFVREKNQIFNFTDDLILNGADVNYTYKNSGCSLVRNSLISEDYEIANYLISKGADLSLVSKNKKFEKLTCGMTVEQLYRNYPAIE